MNPVLLRIWPVAVLLSAVLAVAGAPFALDQPALVFVCKPLTTLLIIGWAWRRGAGTPLQRRWIVGGLVLSLAGDVALLWPQQGFVAGLVAFLLAHLAYIRAFCVPVRFAARPVLFAVYGVVAGLRARESEALASGASSPARSPPPALVDPRRRGPSPFASAATSP